MLTFLAPPLRSLCLATALIVALATAFLLPAAHDVAAQEATFAFDAGIAGNDATTVGEIEDCVEVITGDQFQMDIVVQDIEDLLAFEMFVDFDPDVVILVAQDVEMFQQANEGSSVLDLSPGTLPDDTGFHSIAAFDSSDPATPDSGSGVLARLTFEAVGEGESPIRFGARDIDQDGNVDRATLLRNADAEPLGDEDGDTFFDGETTDATVAVDAECPAGSTVAEAIVTTASPTPEATNGDGDSGDDDDFPVALVAAAVAAGVVLVGGLSALLMRSRRRNA